MLILNISENVHLKCTLAPRFRCLNRPMLLTNAFLSCYVCLWFAISEKQLQHCVCMWICECVEAKRRAAKQSIKEAMANQDIEKLKRAIADGTGVLSDSELEHAKKLLDFLRISQGLSANASVYVVLINLHCKL